MIINGPELLKAAPIKNMLHRKVQAHGVSHGLSEVGYDIQIKQKVRWTPPNPYKAYNLFENRLYQRYDFETNLKKAFFGFTEVITEDNGNISIVEKIGRTAIASSVEEFQIPSWLWCEFRNKSTHARRFVDATIGTDGEPGWKGFLTIEIIFHDNEPLEIPAGSGILKAVFHEIDSEVRYHGKYQDQADRPVAAILD